MALSKLQQQALSKLTAAGNSDLGVALDQTRLNYLIAITARDLGIAGIVPEDVSPPDLYDRVPSELLRVDAPGFINRFEALLGSTPDADTYFTCLGTLLKARLKYERILQAQPVPSVEQIGPRSLLQFGHIEPEALAAFLFWRKWIFDIDNRAGQETGYLFEPILAQAIGGVPMSARKSPVKRGGSGGKGRQVDCLREVGDHRLAYELKLRVTIAASGQGRWREELSFPEDCQLSGYKPVLVVFDGIPNPKLSELSTTFRRAGGEVHIGADAWEHLEQEAGDTMSLFLERYVREPVDSMLTSAPDALPPITFSMNEGKLIVSVAHDQLVVTRVEGASESEDQPLPDDVDGAVGGA